MWLAPQHTALRNTSSLDGASKLTGTGQGHGIERLSARLDLLAVLSKAVIIHRTEGDEVLRRAVIGQQRIPGQGTAGDVRHHKPPLSHLHQLSRLRDRSQLFKHGVPASHDE